MELTKSSAGALVPAQFERAMALTEQDIAKLGESASQGLSTIPNRMLAGVRASDGADIGAELNKLVLVAKGLDPARANQKGVIASIRNVFSNTKERMLADYNTAEKQMDSLVTSLDQKALTQLQSIKDMDTLYVQNMELHQNLERAKAEGEIMLADLDAYIKAQPAAPDAFTGQLIADKVRLLARVEKKIHNLGVNMMMAMQFAPQIRLSQDNAYGLIQAFQEVKTGALPAWKSAFTLYLTQREQANGAALVEASRSATETALRRGADLLRQNSADIARINQAPMVSIETLQYVQTQLLGSFEDIRQINEAGKAQRATEAPMLLQMEKDLIAQLAPGQR